MLACGSTYFFDALAFWFPVYRLTALLRLITRILSWITVFYVVKSLSIAFLLKSQKEFSLALVTKIISKHSGKVWAEGKVDKVPVFIFPCLLIKAGFSSDK